MPQDYKKKALQPMVLDMSRAQPYSEGLEKSVLGIMITIKGSILKTSGIIKEDTFYFEYHQVIFKAITNLFAKDAPIDGLLGIEELKKMGKLNGDTITEVYISKLSNGVVNDSSLEMWVRKLEELAIARRNIQIHLNAIDRYYKNEEDVFDIGTETDSLLFAARNSLDSYKNISPVRIGQDFLKHIIRAKNFSGMTGVPTGIRSLDEILGGFQPQTVNTVGALPSVGKSAVAASFMYDAAINGDPVGFCSMEMRDIELYSRIVSKHLWVQHQVRIEYSMVMRGIYSDEQFVWIEQAVREIDQLPIYIDDVPALNTMQLKSKTMKLINDHGIKGMFVDYIQLMEKITAWGGNTADAISQNMRDIKKISKSLNIAMIPLSQVDRRVGKDGKNGKATMQDLKGSGGIEENSDVILLLDRPELYDPDDYAEKGMMHIVIAKHKQGSKGEIVVPFDLAINTEVELSYEDRIKRDQASAYPSNFSIRKAPSDDEDSDPPF